MSKVGNYATGIAVFFLFLYVGYTFKYNHADFSLLSITITNALESVVNSLLTTLKPTFNFSNLH